MHGQLVFVIDESNVLKELLLSDCAEVVGMKKKLSCLHYCIFSNV